MNTIEIKANHGYFMGASSSPDYVLVLSVDERRVRLVKPYGSGQSYSIDLGSARSLIRYAHETMRIQAAQITRPEFAEAYAARLALHGAPATPEDFDRYHVVVKPVAGVWDSSENWYAAEEYGNVGGYVPDETLTIELRGANTLEKLRQDSRFTLVSSEISEKCARE
jgi:hypothetical protein